MTTATRQDTRSGGLVTLSRAASVALGAGLGTSAVALLVDGSRGLLAALLGTVVVVLVLFNGALVVDVVSRLMPAASLMVAMLTYTLQMVVVALLLLPLSTTDWAAEHLVDTWLAVAVIVCALVWTVSQVLLATRRRIPVYDLAPEAPADAVEVSER